MMVMTRFLVKIPEGDWVGEIWAHTAKEAAEAALKELWEGYRRYLECDVLVYECSEVGTFSFAGKGKIGVSVERKECG